MVILLAAEVGALDIDRAALSEGKRERLSRLRPADALLSAGAECLLNEAFARLLPAWPRPVSCEKKERGKPFVKDCPLRFSLSHSGSLAVCAAGYVELGTDVETPRRPKRDIARRFFTEGERASIAAAEDGDEEFLRIWTRKESYIKYLGAGLACPLPSFDVTGERVSADAEEQTCSLWSWRGDGYIISLCARGDTPKVELHEGVLTPDGHFCEK